MKAYLSYMKKILIGMIILIVVSTIINVVMAAEDDDEIIGSSITPEENQYLELRAVEIKEVSGQNKQVIMELWGNNVDFKRI